MYEDGFRKSENEQYGIRIIGRDNAVLDGGRDNGLREQLWTDDKPFPHTGCFIILCNVRDYVYV